MAEIVAADGYEAVTVRKLTKLAGVSAQAFYRHYQGKEECFLDAYDDAVRQLTRRIVAAARRENGWEDRLRVSLSAFTTGVAEYPKMARLVLVEAYAVGTPALERTRHIFGLSEAIVRDGFEHRPGTAVVESLIVKGLVAGAVSVAQMRVVEGRQSELPQLAVELADWTLCFGGTETDALGRLTSGWGSGRGARRSFEHSPMDTGRVDRNRSLILAAVAKLARSERIEDISSRRIRIASGVSSRAFGEVFPSSRASLLAALEHLVRGAAGRALREGAAAPTWPRGVFRAIAAFCQEVALDSSLARLGFTEALTLGPEAVRQRVVLTAELRDKVRASAPEAMRPTEMAAEASIGAIWTILQHQAAAGRNNSLPRFAPALALMVLAPAIGGGAALDEIRQETEMWSAIQP